MVSLDSIVNGSLKMQTDEPEFSHKSVLLDEILQIIRVERCSLVIDATLGLGGHSEAVLEASKSVKVIGFDQDESAIKMANTRLKKFGSRFKAVHENFSKIREFLESEEILNPDMIFESNAPVSGRTRS